MMIMIIIMNKLGSQPSIFLYFQTYITRERERECKNNRHMKGLTNRSGLAVCSLIKQPKAVEHDEQN